MQPVRLASLLPTHRAAPEAAEPVAGPSGGRSAAAAAPVRSRRGAKAASSAPQAGAPARKPDIQSNSWSTANMLRHGGLSLVDLASAVALSPVIYFLTSELLKTPPAAQPMGFTLDDINRLSVVHPNMTLQDLRHQIATNRTSADWNTTLSAVQSLAGGGAGASGFTVQAFVLLGIVTALTTVTFAFRTKMREALTDHGRRNNLIAAGDDNEQKHAEIEAYLQHAEAPVVRGAQAAYKAIKGIVEAGKSEMAINGGKVNERLGIRAAANNALNVDYNLNRPYRKISNDAFMGQASRIAEVYPKIDALVAHYPEGKIREQCYDFLVDLMQRNAELKATDEHFARLESSPGNALISLARPDKVTSGITAFLVGEPGGTGKDNMIDAAESLGQPVARCSVDPDILGGPATLFPKTWNAFKQMDYDTATVDVLGKALMAVFNGLEPYRQGRPGFGVNPLLYFPELDLKNPAVADAMKILCDPAHTVMECFTLDTAFDLRHMHKVASSNVKLSELDPALKTRAHHKIEFEYSTTSAQRLVSKKRFDDLSQQYREPLMSGERLLDPGRAQLYEQAFEDHLWPNLAREMALKVHGARPMATETLMSWLAGRIDRTGEMPSLEAIQQKVDWQFEDVPVAFDVQGMAHLRDVAPFREGGTPARRPLRPGEASALSDEPSSSRAFPS